MMSEIRRKYLSDLKLELRHLGSSDFNSVIDYVNELIDDTIDDGYSEAEAIGLLPDPESAAREFSENGFQTGATRNDSRDNRYRSTGRSEDLEARERERIRFEMEYREKEYQRIRAEETAKVRLENEQREAIRHEIEIAEATRKAKEEALKSEDAKTETVKAEAIKTTSKTRRVHRNIFKLIVLLPFWLAFLIVYTVSVVVMWVLSIVLAVLPLALSLAAVYLFLLSIPSFGISAAHGLIAIAAGVCCLGLALISSLLIVGMFRGTLAYSKTFPKVYRWVFTKEVRVKEVK